MLMAEGCYNRRLETCPHLYKRQKNSVFAGIKLFSLSIIMIWNVVVASFDSLYEELIIPPFVIHWFSVIIHIVL